MRRSSAAKKSKDIPATQGMLIELRSEMNHQFTSFRLEVDARFKQVDARFNQVDARFNQVDARFNQVDARLDKVEAKIEKVLAAVHRVGLLVEEQNARNIYVLDGYTNLSDRLDRVEKKLDKS